MIKHTIRVKFSNDRAGEFWAFNIRNDGKFLTFSTSSNVDVSIILSNVDMFEIIKPTEEEFRKMAQEQVYNRAVYGS